MHDQDTPGTDDTHGGQGPAADANIHDGTVTRLPTDTGSRDSGTPSSAGSTGILAQLQQLISQVASAPVTREVAAKAAELAALAAEKAGPAARSLAERTESVGNSVAGRATTFASSLRSDQPAAGDPGVRT